eukprot:TRINITY_DN76355_c0_g1_i1.p1 TRINITY_DN76355_c0_g1~~TRINITY_DN76355_c0_g1_i1.p1  ORF type:complete len:319 (+),score=16.50 TRINITY_DN76355_c0_g1_i1:47-1003(+)
MKALLTFRRAGVRMAGIKIFPGEHIFEMTDSTPLVNEQRFNELQTRLHTDGYLLLRNQIPANIVLQARRQAVSVLHDLKAIDPRSELTPGTPSLSLVGTEGAAGIYDTGNKSQTVLLNAAQDPVRAAELLPAFERVALSLAPVLEQIVGEPISWQQQYTLPRAVIPGDFTGFHYDSVYFGPANARGLTTWIPIGDVGIPSGPLVVAEGSNHHEKLLKTYGEAHTTRDNIEGWFSRDPMDVIKTLGCRLVTSTFNGGDVVLFGMHTLHGSLDNETTHYRLSSDTRFIPTAEKSTGAPQNPPMQPATAKTMAHAREEWGI